MTPHPTDYDPTSGSAGSVGETSSNDAEPQVQPSSMSPNVTYATQNPDEQSDGIFSTPDLTVSNEHVPDPSLIREDDKTRIAAVFQKHDASGRRRAAEAKAAAEQEMQNQARWDQNVSGQNLQNSESQAARAMNAAALRAADIPSTATGDIRLPGEKKKHSKAPLIILFLLVLAGATTGLVGWQMGWFGNPSGGGETEVPANEAKAKFDRFATYLLYGASSNELTGDYESGRVYTLEDQLEENDANYWKTASDLLAAAVSGYQSLENPDKNLALFLTNYQQNFAFIDAYRGTAELADEDILAYYITNGPEATASYINNYYSSFSGLASEYAKQYVEAKTQQYQAFVALLNIYNDGGCIGADGLDNACVDSLYATLANEITTNATTSSQQGQIANELIEQLVQRLESDCWRISAQFDPPAADDEETENS